MPREYPLVSSSYRRYNSGLDAQIQLNHELQYLIIQGNKSIFPVFADGRTDEDGLVLDGYIANLYLRQLIRTNECVIFKKAS